MSDVAYLPDQSFSRSLSQPVVVPPVVSQLVVVQPIVGQPGVGRPSADQPSGPIPPLLSLWLQPDLNVLTRTLSPQASPVCPHRHPDRQDPIKLNYNG